MRDKLSYYASSEVWYSKHARSHADETGCLFEEASGMKHTCYSEEHDLAVVEQIREIWRRDGLCVCVELITQMGREW